MSFYEWLFSMAEYPIIDNPVVNGRWGLLHILTLLCSILAIIGIAFIYKYSKNKEKTRKIILFTLAGILLFFDIVIKFVRFHNYWNQLTFKQVMWILLPRPWCAISGWSLILCGVVNKNFFYNYASTTALLCAIMFFICPGVGYNNKYILFDNLYSIVTHCVLLIMSISLITLRYADFRYTKHIWKEALALILTIIYAIIMIILKFESDPMYFMPNGDIQTGILGISYILYIILYVVFLLLYFNTFYIITERTKIKNIFKNKNK